MTVRIQGNEEKISNGLMGALRGLMNGKTDISGFFHGVGDAFNGVENPMGNSQSAGAVKKNSGGPIAELKARDEYFSEAKFLAWANEVFIAYQQAIMFKKPEKARPFTTDEAYGVVEYMVEDDKKNGVLEHRERIGIQNSVIASYEVDKELGLEYLWVKVDAQMMYYSEDEATGKILRGDSNNLHRGIWSLVFQRKVGVKTPKEMTGIATTNCPNCGAPTDVTSGGYCSYCNSLITSGDYNWVLSDVE